MDLGTGKEQWILGGAVDPGRRNGSQEERGIPSLRAEIPGRAVDPIPGGAEILKRAGDPFPVRLDPGKSSGSDPRSSGSLP